MKEKMLLESIDLQNFDHFVRETQDIFKRNHTSNDDYEITVHSLWIDGLNIGEIPIKIHRSLGTTCLEDNGLTSFESVPSHAGHLRISRNKITSLEGVHKHLLSCTKIILSSNDIISGGLGLLLVDNLKHITYNDINTYQSYDGEYNYEFKCAVKILNKYLRSDDKIKRILYCQQELIDNDLEEYAVL